MNTLYVFGDSYSAVWYDLSWSSVIAKRLNLQNKNFAIGGSSTEYSFNMFIKCFKYNIFKSGDVIIFQCSEPGRLHLEYQNSNPKSAMFGYRATDSGDTKKDRVWYYMNEDYIKWYIANVDYKLLDYNMHSYIHLIRSFAENNPFIKTLILYKNTSSIDISMKSLPNFLNTKLSLQSVSSKEFTDSENGNYFKYLVSDCRMNHLTMPNLKIFTDSIENMILTMNDSSYTYSAFLQNILPTIETLQDIEKYVELGYLHPVTLKYYKDFFKK